MRLAAEEIRSDELTAEAEALEASGAELAIEPVEAIAEREQLEVEAAAALAIADRRQPLRHSGRSHNRGSGNRPTGRRSAWRRNQRMPEDYPIKGNASSKLYHSPGSPSYKRTVPEFCFASTEVAEAAGFNPTKYEAAHEEAE